MAKKLLLLLSLATLLIPPAAHALTDPGDVIKWCSQSSAAASGRCLGYLLAADSI